MKLLSKNTKLEKGEELGWETWGVSLLPNTMGGGINLCPWASKGCLLACLESAGMGIFPNVREARLQRTKLLLADKARFIALLCSEIEAKERRASKRGIKLAIRLNVLSDVLWEKMGIFERFPGVQFYDYTPNPVRLTKYLLGELPRNYHLTFSRKEDNQLACEAVLRSGGNVAVVFDTVPKTWQGFAVVDGDLSDLRFLDPAGTVVGLKAKGKGKQDDSGFVVLTGGGSN